MINNLLPNSYNFQLKLFNYYLIYREIMKSNIITRDMKSAGSGLNKEEVYNYNGIIINNKYEIKHKRISDSNVLLGKIKISEIREIKYE